MLFLCISLHYVVNTNFLSPSESLYGYVYLLIFFHLGNEGFLHVLFLKY